MNKDKIDMKKIVCITTAILLVIINFLTFFLIFTDRKISLLIPCPQIIIAIVQVIVLILSIFICFKYNLKIQFLIFQVESLICMISEFQTLGIFLYYLANFIITLNLYNDKKVKFYLIIPFPFHIFSQVVNLLYDWSRGLLYLFTSVFILICFFWFYQTVKIKFSCFMPTTVTKKSLLSDLKAGSKIFLSEYGLTERQVNFIYDFINLDLTYKDLSEKYFTSLSTVKREFTEVYKIFNVSKMEELHILLLQYVVCK